jgi:SulP family sulfate permease
MVPHPVMLGFVNGLAIVIFLSQLGQFKVPGDDAAGFGRRGLVAGVASSTRCSASSR